MESISQSVSLMNSLKTGLSCSAVRAFQWERAPGFRDLAQAGLKQLLGDDPIVAKDLDLGRYEAVFQAIRDDIPSELLLRFLEDKLSFRNEATLESHQALLCLSQTRDGQGVRLVTTNFDRGSFTAFLRKAGNHASFPYGASPTADQEGLVVDR